MVQTLPPQPFPASPIPDDDARHGLHELGYKIFLDRYAMKDMKRQTLAVGDTVIVVVNPQTGQREIGHVTAMALPEVTIQLLDGEVVTRSLEHVDKPLETDPRQMMARVAQGIAASEPTPEKQAEWKAKFEWLLEDFKFVPAGRILTAAGTNQELTFYNCFVVPSPTDSRGGIIETLRLMTEIMSRGGGVGINLSSLRPRHAFVSGVNGRSSGSVSWGALYSFVTGLIEQGGCFGPDERIATDKGLIPARELADRMDAGETFAAHTHKGLRPITDRFRNGVKPLYEVTTERGYKLRVTPDHKIATLIDGTLVTIPLRDLAPGDEILLLLGEGVQGDYVPLKPVEYDYANAGFNLNTKIDIPQVLDERLAYLLGYMYGDGYVHWQRDPHMRNVAQAVRMATSDEHPDIRQKLIDTIQNVFGIEPNLRQGDGRCINVSIYSQVVVEWFSQNGLLKQKAADVHVPEAIFRSPSSVQAAFIAGYFDADGCYRGKKGGYGMDSISRQMLADVQQLLILNGIVSRISATDRSAQGWQTIYRLSVTGARFKTRFAAFVPTLKRGHNGIREENTYPAQVWTALGERAKFRQRIYDGVSDRIGYAQMEKIGVRLAEAGRTESVAAIADLLRTLPDRITALEPLGDGQSYDFEVEEVHLLSANGYYTSNSRRGALMLILNDWHPDVFEFINSKREAGKITNANISVGVSDRLMEAVKADADWELVFPDTHHPQYDAEWDGDIDTWRGKGYPVVRHKTVKAREVWDAIITSAWASAEPGVFFNERYNKMSNSWYHSPIIATNPCFTGDTRIYTNQGLIRARELFDNETDIEITIDGRFGLTQTTTRSTRVFRTGHKAVYQLQTRQGYSVRATADHRFMTPRGWVELKDLQPGDAVHVLNRKGGFGTQGDLRIGRTLGWLVGDGTVKKAKQEIILSFFGDEKRELAPMFAEYVNEIAAPLTTTRRSYPVGIGNVAERDEARVTSTRLYTAVEPYGLTQKKHQVPEAVFQGTEDMQRGFLQALFTADGGSQQTAVKAVVVRLASSQIELLEQVQQLLANFGISCRIYRNRRIEMRRMMPDSKGGYKEYMTRAQHELAISKSSVVTFQQEIGFLTTRKNQLLAERLATYKTQPRPDTYLAMVESITYTGEEDVFDLTEPITHSVVVNGLVSHQCGEQGLPGYGVCNLGAINLSRFYDPETNDVQWDDLDRAVRYATRFLDDVIDTTMYFFEENRQQQLGERRVGLNNMGLAELLVRLGIRYGSPESLDFIDRLYSFIARASYETSIALAEEKGAFPMLDADKFIQSGFMQTMPDDLREAVRTRGIRNVTLLTQAPNGTTGTMVNTSTGIEPFFSWVYYRKSRLGLHEEQVPLAREWFEAHPGETQLPDYFVTAMELTPEEHADVQGAIQRWVDSSISKTSNLPNHYTIEQTRAFYEYMYEIGCKGGTVYRDGSRDEQVLMLKGDARAEKEMEQLKDKAADVQAVSVQPEPAPLTAPANGIMNGGHTNGNGHGHETIKVAARTDSVDPAATPHRVYPRPKKLTGTTISTRTGFGTAYITMNSDENGCPFEVFITAPGKAGSDLQADAEGLGRMISLQLRTTAPQNRTAMLRLIVDQLKDIGGSRAYGLGPNRILSLPDAVARALADTYLAAPAEQQLDLFTPPEIQVTLPPASPAPTFSAPPVREATAPVAASQPIAPLPVPSVAVNVGLEIEAAPVRGYSSGADVCPSCGTVSLMRVDGCRKCSTCGYSEC